MSELITDAMVEAAAEAFANHEYRINGPEMTPYCTCGQAATLRYDVDWYDQHVARLTLEVVAPLIAAKAWEEGYAEGSRGRIWESANPYQTHAEAIEDEVPNQIAGDDS